MLPLPLQLAQARGHVVFTEGLFNLNLIGFRSPNRRANEFDDLMTITYRDHSRTWLTRSWPITTDPGNHYLMSKDRQLNPLGTAILAAGQYRGAYGIGPHGPAKYEALTQQHGKVTVYRDGDLDAELDLDPRTAQEGFFGINIHASDMTPYEGQRSRDKVGAWSAGCQVFKNEWDFRQFMSICKEQLTYHPTWERFTYTLIDLE